MTTQDTAPTVAPDNQGEGNTEAARRYNEDQKRFVKSGGVRQAAEDAAPRDAAEAEELQRAEEEGLARAKGEDPTVPGAASARERRA
ncbi:MAG TPA: hypothetical protein VIW70_07985 [Rubrivivax sp.]